MEKSQRSEKSFYSRVYELVRLVPRGRVATYGQVATLLGSPRAARAVGYALYFLPEAEVDRVPWHRVLNSAGGISAREDGSREALQRGRLEAEGVPFRADGTVDLSLVRWADPLFARGAT